MEFFNRMENVFETNIKIRAFDVDANDRLKVSTIFDFLQDAASNDAERLNLGYSEFVPKGLFWVLSWMKIECIKFPKFMDEVKVQTWGKKQYKLYSMRDYLLINAEQEIICRATSAWLLLDVKTMRPKILTELFPELIMPDTGDALIDLPQKIKLPKEIINVYASQIRYSDIDLNQHANNAKYIELMLDCFDQQFHKSHSMKSLTVSFSAESKFGDEINLGKGVLKDNPLTHYIEAKNLISGKTAFQAMIGWN